MSAPYTPALFKFEDRDLDIRRVRTVYDKTGISLRYIDQKVTPDVLCAVAGSILEIDPHGTQDFTAIDIRKSDTFTYDFTKTFNKPAPTNATVASEYDKVSSQPLKTLHYAGVLSAERRGSTIAYEILDLDILTTIASRELKAYRFLVDYLIATNEQSTLTPIYESFYCSPQSQADFHAFKTSYIRYILRNTRINRDVEVRRILPKALNPIAVAWGMRGAKGGHASRDDYVYADLMYNASNFRDFHKPKNVSRQEAIKLANQSSTKEHQHQQQRRLMQAVLARHARHSEIRDSLAVGEATQVHHIFPSSLFPTLRNEPENLITLTPSQHTTRAHPSNRTHEVDAEYQLTCLLAKLESVRRSEEAQDGFYQYAGLVQVLNTGYEWNVSPDLGYSQIKRLLLNRLAQG